MTAVVDCLVCCETVEEYLKCPCCDIKVCSECFITDIKSNDTFSRINRVNSEESGVKCIDKNCKGEILLRYICIFMSTKNFDVFLVEWNKMIKSKTEYELCNANKNDETDEVSHMVNFCTEVMSPSCPCCRQAFDEFTGCFAVKCSRCPSTFCAWCLEYFDNSDKVHQHVLFCYNKLSRDEDGYYGTKEQFEYSFSSIVMNKINEMIEDKPYSIVSKVFGAISNILSIHNLCVVDGKVSRKNTHQTPYAFPVEYNNYDYDDEIEIEDDDYYYQPDNDDYYYQPAYHQPDLQPDLPQEEIDIEDNNMRLDAFENVVLVRRINFLPEPPEPQPFRIRRNKCGVCGNYGHNRRTCVL